MTKTIDRRMPSFLMANLSAAIQRDIFINLFGLWSGPREDSQHVALRVLVDVVPMTD